MISKKRRVFRLTSTAREDLEKNAEQDSAKLADIELQRQQELDDESKEAEKQQMQDLTSALLCIQGVRKPNEMITPITKDAWDSPRNFIERLEFSVNPKYYPSTIICLGMATGSNRCSCLYIKGREPKLAEIAVAILQESKYKERIRQDLREGHYEKKNLYYGFYYVLLNEAEKNQEAQAIERLLLEGFSKIRSRPIGAVILQQIENTFRLLPLPA